MNLSATGLRLISEFEGLYLTGYLCSAGRPTIGWGHTGSVDGVPVRAGMVITKEKAIELLAADMVSFEDSVKSLTKIEPTQNQFDALVSLAFNIGAGALGGSTLLRMFNAGKIQGAADQFLVWDKYTDPRTGEKKVSAGLVRRRKSERHLFLTGELNFFER